MIASFSMVIESWPLRLRVNEERMIEGENKWVVGRVKSEGILIIRKR